MHISHTPPDPQMINTRFPSIPKLIWCRTLQSRCGTTIQNMNKCSQTLSPECFGQARLRKHCRDPFPQYPICPLCNPILLWSVSHRMLPNDSICLEHFKGTKSLTFPLHRHSHLFP